MQQPLFPGARRRPENATVTAYCLSLLDAELRPLKRHEADGALLPQVSTDPAPVMNRHVLHHLCNHAQLCHDHLLLAPFCQSC